MLKNISYLKVGQKGVINFDIPVYTIGDGKPEFAVTCSVHGDETAGLFIVSEFLELIKDMELKGTIHIIPAANPVAQFINSRVAFLDLKDLNRLNEGSKNGSYTERVGFALFNFLAKCDFVVNIHEFEMKTPVTGIFDNFGEDSIKQKNLKAVQLFNPEMIWQINYDQSCESQYQTTLDMALTNAGVTNFAFETSQLSHITKGEIKRAAQGLVNIIADMGIIDKNTDDLQQCLRLTRKEFTSELAGLWEPEDNLTLLQNIKKGDLIGRIKSLPDFEATDIYADFAGPLMQYRHRQIISTGTAIYSIGIKN